jgi:hypothetical protein
MPIMNVNVNYGSKVRDFSRTLVKYASDETRKVERLNQLKSGVISYSGEHVKLSGMQQ